MTYAERIRNIRRRFYAEILDGIALLIIFAWCIYMLLQVAADLVLAAALQIIRWGRP
jgi:hypothetical protein